MCCLSVVRPSSSDIGVDADASLVRRSEFGQYPGLASSRIPRVWSTTSLIICVAPRASQEELSLRRHGRVTTRCARELRVGARDTHFDSRGTPESAAVASQDDAMYCKVAHGVTLSDDSAEYHDCSAPPSRQDDVGGPCDGTQSRQADFKSAPRFGATGDIPTICTLCGRPLLPHCPHSVHMRP